MQDWHAQNNFDCKETKVYYVVNRPYLEKLGGVYNGSIDWDESNNLTTAMFFLTAVDETNLFLLVISDYNNETKTCARLDRYGSIVFCKCGIMKVCYHLIRKMHVTVQVLFHYVMFVRYLIVIISQLTCICKDLIR